jgi:hypothetical protein
MKRVAVVLICLGVCLFTSFIANGEGAPVVKKLGTVDCDLVETTPIVFHDKLYLFESVRDNYKPNATGKSYFQFVDVATGERTPPFARGYHLGCAFVNGDDVYVYGVDAWGASSVHVFWSKDLGVWKDQIAMELAGWRIFNTSVCKGADGFMMAFEIDAPKDEAGTGFTMRFAKSDDLRNWRLTPKECVYTKDRYSACPSLRFVDGLFYMVYLEAYPGPMYEPCIVRSKDLIKWEESRFKPIMKHSDEDRTVANKNFSEQEKNRIVTAGNLNNSDLDFCQFKNKTVIYYSWGNQQGVEHLAKAEYDGSEMDFLKGFFPAP